MCRSFAPPAREQVVSQEPACDIDDVAIWLAEVARLDHLGVEAGRDTLRTMSVEYTGEELGAGVCVILVEMEPGGSVRLHRHPYEEVFIVQAGEATFRLGDEERVVKAPDVVVAPAGIPHGFANKGSETLRQVDIHVSAAFDTEWLE